MVQDEQLIRLQRPLGVRVPGTVGELAPVQAECLPIREKQAYATASVVTAERIVFNIKGNSYRLVVAADFEKGIVWIKWIGAHADYDRIDVTEVQHER